MPGYLFAGIWRPGNEAEVDNFCWSLYWGMVLLVGFWKDLVEEREDSFNSGAVFSPLKLQPLGVCEYAVFIQRFWGHDYKVLFKSGRIYLRKPFGGGIKEFRLNRDLQVLLDDIVLLASCQACRGFPRPLPFLNRLRVSAVIAENSMPAPVLRLRCRGCGLPWCQGCWPTLQGVPWGSPRLPRQNNGSRRSSLCSLYARPRSSVAAF